MKTNIEIIPNNENLVEVDVISRSSYQEIESTTSSSFTDVTKGRNTFLNIVAAGASVIMPSQAYSSTINAKDFKIEKTNSIESVLRYSKTVNKDIVNYLDKINSASKRKITKQSLLLEILSFKSLNENWDGYGAYPLEVESATKSILLMEKIGENVFCSVDNFYPNPNGTISFEWENNEGELISLEVGNETFSYYVEMASMEVKYFNNQSVKADNDVERLKKYIQAI